MTVGEALAEARGAAGLSVDEVSERTRIRAIVIRSIEQDDFGGLGGDLYVRGYLRAIAGAVGVDPQPLIREFDATRPGGPGGRHPDTTAVEAVEPVEPVEAPTVVDSVIPASAESTVVDHVAAGPAADPGPPADWAASPAPGDTLAGDFADGAPDGEHAAGVVPAEEATSSWDPFSWEPASEPYLGSWGDDAVADLDPDPMPGVWEVPAAQVTSAAVGPGPMTRSQPPEGPSRASASSKVSASSKASASRVRGPRWVAMISVLTVVVLALVGVAGAEIASKLHSAGKASAATKSATAPVTTPSATARPSVLASATPAATPTPAVQPTVTVQRLSVLYADAFGPYGVGDGDNQQYADNAITAGAALPWRTNWYTTANFGRLKHGTGLLLAMGKRVTVTSVRIQLGDEWGASVQIRAGITLASLPVLSSATDTGGLITLTLRAPTRARYVLIWFTRLPPTPSGTYQASVYSATVLGRP